MSETKHVMHGVEGNLTVMNWPNSPLFMHQKFIATRPHPTEPKLMVAVEVRFDDNCKNGHNSFAITGHTYYPGRRDCETCGCIHDIIEQVFPELSHLIKWHLSSTDGPMHYVANTTYHASNRDSRGALKGEPCAWTTRVQFGKFPILYKGGFGFFAWLKTALEFNAAALKTNPKYKHFNIVAVEHKKDSTSYNFEPKYSFDDFTNEWHKCPFDTQDEAERFKQAMAYGVRFVKVASAWGEGKERNFDAARRTAVWPEATDEQLSLPKEALTELLTARLPALIADFRADMESCGFVWSVKESGDGE